MFVRRCAVAGVAAALMVTGVASTLPVAFADPAGANNADQSVLPDVKQSVTGKFSFPKYGYIAPEVPVELDDNIREIRDRFATVSVVVEGTDHQRANDAKDAADVKQVQSLISYLEEESTGYNDIIRNEQNVAKAQTLASALSLSFHSLGFGDKSGSDLQDVSLMGADGAEGIKFVAPEGEDDALEGNDAPELVLNSIAAQFFDQLGASPDDSTIETSLGNGDIFWSDNGSERTDESSLIHYWVHASWMTAVDFNTKQYVDDPTTVIPQEGSEHDQFAQEVLVLTERVAAGDEPQFFADRLKNDGDRIVLDEDAPGIQGVRGALDATNLSDSSRESLQSYVQVLEEVANGITDGKAEEYNITFGEPEVEPEPEVIAAEPEPEVTEEEGAGNDGVLDDEDRTDGQLLSTAQITDYPSGEMPRVGDVYEAVTETPWRLRSNASMKPEFIAHKTQMGDVLTVHNAIGYSALRGEWHEVSPEMASWLVVSVNSDGAHDAQRFFIRWTMLVDDDDYRKISSGADPQPEVNPEELEQNPEGDGNPDDDIEPSRPEDGGAEGAEPSNENPGTNGG